MNHSLVRAAAVALLATTLAAPLAAQDIRAIDPGPSRRGFWIGLGLAASSVDADCNACNSADPQTFGGSHIRLGGTLSPHVRLGADLFGATKKNGIFGDLTGSSVDVTETAGHLVASIWYYPQSAGNLWLQFGMGGVVYQADVKSDQKYSAVGGGGLLGIGYDFRVGRNGSITPYLNFVGSSDGKLKDEDGNEITGGDKWKTRYVTLGVDYVFH
jgi:hypothetical protein